MTQDEIRAKRAKLTAKRLRLFDEVAMLQQTCQHPTPEKKYGSNTGNYDPTADIYWIDYTCHDCGHRWSVRQ